MNEPTALTFTELELLEKQADAEFETYMARHENYLKQREVAKKILRLASIALAAQVLEQSVEKKDE